MVTLKVKNLKFFDKVITLKEANLLMHLKNINKFFIGIKLNVGSQLERQLWQAENKFLLSFINVFLKFFINFVSNKVSLFLLS